MQQSKRTNSTKIRINSSQGCIAIEQISDKLNTMTIRWIITFAFLILALVCYASGFGAGGTLFLILGVVFEILFWFGVYGNTKSKKT